MATKITRQDQAARDLVPAGWHWMDSTPSGPYLGARDTYDGLKRWSWGYLVLDTPRSIVSRVTAYKALIDLMLKYAVIVRTQEWGLAGGSRVPSAVAIMPASTSDLAVWASDWAIPKLPDGKVDEAAAYTRYLEGYKNEFNLHGWTMSDGTEIPVGQITRDGAILCCQRCKRSSPGLVSDPSDPTNNYCRRCVRVCPGDGIQPCTVPIFDGDFSGCEAHYPRDTCPTCKKVWEVRNLTDHAGVLYCVYCIATICQRCQKVGAVDPNTELPLTDGHEQYHVCSKCRKDVQAWLGQDRNERVVLERVCNMGLTPSPHRPIRLASLELEVTSGARGIGKDLFKKGLTLSPELAVHWQGNTSDFCYLEQDSSLPDGGGEVIFSKMRLDDEATAQKLGEAIGVIRKAVKAGDATIDLRTGVHVHVDYHKCGFNHVRNLVILHNYLEDPLYRLSAANYTRHRGTYYATVLPKTGLETQEDFLRYFFNRGNREQLHHSVLNVNEFYRAVANCMCGNIASGNPEDCNCQLGKCTVEFRSFNGTSSWKKIHAYLALCMSLADYARNVDDLDVNDFPPCLYNAVGLIGSDLKAGWIERLRWMFQNLWFSPAERESIHYCIEQSELNKLTFSERRELRNTEYKGVKYVATKAPAKAEQTMVPKLRDNPFLPPTSRRAAIYGNGLNRPPTQRRVPVGADAYPTLTSQILTEYTTLALDGNS